jgi:phosphate-selective porin
LVSRIIAVFAVATVAVSLPRSTSAQSVAAHNWQSYTQVRYTAVEDQKGYLSLRRLKLFGQGPIAGDWSYYLQFLYKANNHSPTDDHVWTQEANAILSSEKGKLTIGQFKPPFGMERFIADWTMPFVERTQPTDRLIPDGSIGGSFARDYGAQWQTKSFRGLTVASGVFVGNGANNSFEGNGPLLVLRAAYDTKHGVDKRFHAEMALSWRKDANIDFRGQLPGAPVGYADFIGQDVRQDVAVAYKWARNSLHAEYIAAQYHSERSFVSSINAAGGYIEWANDLTDRWQAAVRYESLSPHTSANGAKGLAWTTLAVNYRVRSDYERVQLDYIIKHENAAQVENNALVVQYQRFFW